MTQKVTSNSITSVDVSKLSGDHTSATYGQNLTGINDGIIESASDPTASSNPAGGLGTLWVNYTSGEMYNLTNASTNSNYWTNVGGKSGDIFYSYTGADGQIGTQYGYCGFGEDHTGGIERFAFASSTSGSNFSTPSETSGWSVTSTTSSKTHGYAASFVTYNSATGHNRFSKFAFSNGSYSGGIDTLSYTPVWPGSCQSATHGFLLGGLGQSRFDRYQFSNDQNQGQWGSLQIAMAGTAGSNDGTHGYWLGGTNNSGPYFTYIGRFEFATQNSQAGVGNLLTGHFEIAAVNDTTHTYYAGSAAPHTSNIKKFAFASSVTIASHGTLHNNIWNGYTCGHSNTTHGYFTGGYSAGTKIQRFAWSSNTTAALAGSLTNSRYRMRGWQK